MAKPRARRSRRKRASSSRWRSITRGVRRVRRGVKCAARTAARAIGRLTKKRDAAPSSETRKLRRAFGRSPPPIRERDCPECGHGGWSGRYHPKRGVAVVATDRHMSPKLRKALRQHERAHGLVCDRKSKTCTYKGDHDRRFYKTLAKAHRTVGTDPKAAEELETRSGYRPPRGFRKAIRRRGRV
jgi:hypothetical protein